MKLRRFFDIKYVYSRRERILPFLYFHIIETAFRAMVRHGLYFTKNDRMLAELKRRHEGQRCFVIGNGPSLSLEDLEKFKENNEITIASNKVYLAFEYTNWRPTYYTVGDLLVAENNIEAIKSLDLAKFFPDHFKTILGRSGDQDCNGIHLYYRMFQPRYDKKGNYRPSFSSNLLKGLHIGETITNVNIQLANYFGCNPIYLIGLDGVYEFPSSTVKHHVYEQVFVSEGEVNHFIANYRKKGETWCIPKPEEHETAFRNSKAYLESKGVTVLNVSRQSSVKAFDRADLESIL